SRRQWPRLHRLPAGAPAHGQHHHPRRPTAHRARLGYDLDESGTTETLDAPSQGVDYTIPFSLIASIAPNGHEESDAQRARVTLQTGEELLLERAGDLGAGNGGMLIFVDGLQRPEYVPWTEVEQIDFDLLPR